jgi:hypothetical protein
MPATLPDAAVATAFDHLEAFRRGALLATLRRLAVWKGLGPQHQDVVDDLRQELALDCVANATLVTNLDRRARHARWFRLVQREHYRLRVRGARSVEASQCLDELPAIETTREARASALDAELAARLARSVHRFKNGRLNAERTAQSLRVGPNRLRTLRCELAEQLGHGAEYRAFWQRRLCEALVGAAAALLHARGALRLFGDRQATLPDHATSLRRLRRIKAALSVCQRSRAVRSALACGLRRPSGPRELLDRAAALEPGSGLVELWRIEAALADGDLRAAVQHVRAARSNGADPVRVVLARAGLCEARGQNDAAQRLLVRAVQRHRGDPRPRASLARLAGS